MKKLLLIALLLGWPLALFAQSSLVEQYRNERISTDFNGNPFDWQAAFQPDFTQTLISREGPLAFGGGVGEVLSDLPSRPAQVPILQRPIRQTRLCHKTPEQL